MLRYPVRLNLKMVSPSLDRYTGYHVGIIKLIKTEVSSEFSVGCSLEVGKEQKLVYCAFIFVCLCTCSLLLSFFFFYDFHFQAQG